MDVLVVFHRHQLGVPDKSYNLFSLLLSILYFLLSFPCCRLMFCPRRAWVTQRRIRLPMFQQPAFYEWVLKLGESWPRSDVSILDTA